MSFVNFKYSVPLFCKKKPDCNPNLSAFKTRFGSGTKGGLPQQHKVDLEKETKRVGNEKPGGAISCKACS